MSVSYALLFFSLRATGRRNTKHQIKYDDGDVQWEDLNQLRWELLAKRRRRSDAVVAGALDIHTIQARAFAEARARALDSARGEDPAARRKRRQIADQQKRLGVTMPFVTPTEAPKRYDPSVEALKPQVLSKKEKERQIEARRAAAKGTGTSTTGTSRAKAVTAPNRYDPSAEASKPQVLSRREKERRAAAKDAASPDADDALPPLWTERWQQTDSGWWVPLEAKAATTSGKQSTACKSSERSRAKSGADADADAELARSGNAASPSNSRWERGVDPAVGGYYGLCTWGTLAPARKRRRRHYHPVPVRAAAADGIGQQQPSRTRV